MSAVLAIDIVFDIIYNGMYYYESIGVRLDSA